MKKVLLIILMTMLTGIVMACQKNNDINTRSLVPNECEHLTNIGDWQPVWCEEFNYEGLPNPDKWGYDVGGHGWGNHELQYYTRANLNNAFVENGRLHIRAIRENFQGSDYTSARLVSKYYGDWLYGRIFVKAKMPSGLGTWPAIWMLPTDSTYGGWPYSGEIDIMEYVGYQPGVVHGTIHTGRYNHMIGTHLGSSINVPTAETEFHIYEMIWEPSKIELFVDGARYAVFGYNPDTNINVENSDAWPFDQRFHLILNLAVGGTWGGLQGVDPDAFPTMMEIEYVRVYQKDYAGLDQEPPGPPSDLVLQRVNHDSARIKWRKATDDVMVRHYNIYVDGIKVGDTTLNAYNLENLLPGTNHLIEVEAEDFKGQQSPKESIAIQTDAVRLATERVRAETYDAMEGVDLEPTTDLGGGNHVQMYDDGDYVEYLLHVQETGTYRINYRVSSPSGGELRLYSRSHLPHTITPIASTGGWDHWTTVTSNTFNLQAGVFTFRVSANEGGFNLNYLEIEKVE